MLRVACISLSEIRLEIAREKEKHSDSKSRATFRSSAALGIIVSRPGSAVESELDISSVTRLDVVSRQAKAQGVRVGETVAAARAKCAKLCVRVIAEDDVRSALIGVAEAALAFGPATSFCPQKDVVWVDIGGCAHLHGSERALAVALEKRVRALGYTCRLVIADGPRIAAAVARFSSRQTRDEIEIVPEGHGAAAISVLPTSALELDDDSSAWLSTLGLLTCGALQRLPRSSFGIRLGQRAQDVFALLGGEDHAPLDVWRPPEVPEERIELEWGASSFEALAFVMKTLCDRLALRLEGRGCAVSTLELALELDRALCNQKARVTSTFETVLPVPIARAADLLAVVRARLERETLAAPALVVTLRALELTRASERPPLALFAPEPKADTVLPRLVAELTAELGDVSVGTLALVDTWIPDGRTRLATFGAPAICAKYPLTVAALEPSRLVSAARISRTALVDTELLERTETVEWWRCGIVRCDVVAAWLDTQAGSGALAWLCLGEGEQDAHLCGWID
jgi:protein ImuB